ncbi:MAG: hypothetical protein ACYC1E_15065 [Propionibacteriaceae bacterium]
MEARQDPSRRYRLDSLPSGSTLRSVTAEPSTAAGRPALRVSLTEAVRRDGRPGVDYVDQPTFVVLPVEMVGGRIQVDICSDLLPDAPEYARAFAGLAFAVAADASSFEAVYVRPYNGLSVAPDGVRRRRAVQYFSYPDWPFDRLREELPDAGFESAADIRPGVWLRLVVEVDARRVRAEVDGVEVVNRERIGRGAGAGVGLFVDIGTDAYFADLVVEPTARG